MRLSRAQLETTPSVVGFGPGPTNPKQPLNSAALTPYIVGMNYVLALLLPPLSILLVGRPILAIVVFLIWVPALVFSGGLTHPMFIILAWVLIFQAREDRRERRIMRQRDRE